LRIGRLSIIGLVMIGFSLLLISVNFFDKIILDITYPFLMGSSKGKSIIFFMVFGLILLVSPSIQNSNLIKNSRIGSKSGNYYLKILIILVFITYVIGLIIEIWIRLKFGVSIFTTFVSTTPSVSTSSLIHSHVYKSMLGILINDTGIYVPSNIHTAISIAQYVPKFAMIIFIVFPSVFILGLLSVRDRPDIQKIILIFSITTTLIGMLDGGLFSAPALVGLAGLMGIFSIKKPFKPKNLIKPSSIIILLLIIRIFISFSGSSPDVYEITVIDVKGNIDMPGINVLNEKSVNNNIIITIYSKINEYEALNDSSNILKSKYPLFFISWNSYSFFSR